MKRRSLIVALATCFILTGCLTRRGEGTNPTTPPEPDKLNGVVILDDVYGDVVGAQVLAGFWVPEEKAESFTGKAASRFSGMTLSQGRAEACELRRTVASGRGQGGYLNLGQISFGIEGQSDLFSVPLVDGNLYSLEMEGGLSSSRYDVVIEGNESYKGMQGQVTLPDALVDAQLNGTTYFDEADPIEISRSSDIVLTWEAPKLVSSYNEMGVTLKGIVGNEILTLDCGVLEETLTSDGNTISWTIPATELVAFEENSKATIHLHRTVKQVSSTKDKSIILVFQGRRSWYRRAQLAD